MGDTRWVRARRWRVPWKVSDPVSERLEFVRRWLEGERVVDLCREFGISRKTAYKMRARYEEQGTRGLFDLSRARKTQGRRIPPEVEKTVLWLRAKHPTWGARKIRAWLIDRQPEMRVPSPSTIGGMFIRNHVARRRMRRQTYSVYGSRLREAVAPNDVWCADFKGQFKLGNGRYCYPLTITDRHSRFIIRCEALESTALDPAMLVFEQAFKEYGLPKVIRTDNGTPFAGHGIWALTRMSVRWLRLGIWPERIAPSHPEQNGQHERMHLVLKQETTRPARANLLQQQERFERFVDVYNNERPHEALGQKPPARLYRESPRLVPGELPDPDYPLHDHVVRVHKNGWLAIAPRHYFRLSTALSGESVGIREVDEGRWLVSFLSLDLGHYDFTTKRFDPSDFTAGGRRPKAAIRG
jgi:transposase InsO family protein